MNFATTRHLPRLALAIALAFPLLASAQSPADLHAQLEQHAKAFFADSKPGGVVLVRKGDQVLLREGFGLADVENHVAMTPEKILRVGSVTKQFTSFAILQLVQAGKLRLDQPVGEVVTDLPPALGIETVTGARYADYMQKSVFAPLGMLHTRFGSHTDLVPGRAHGYRVVKEVLENADFISMTQPQGAGSLISTVDDLARWDLALSEGRLVDKGLMQQAFTKVQLRDGRQMPYGFGWMISDVQGRTSNEHSGFINGFSSYTLRVPEQKVYVTVLSNSEQFWLDDFAVELAAIALGQPFDRTPAKTVDATAWVGRYDFGKDGMRELKLEDGLLSLLHDGDKPVKVTPAMDGRYYLDEGLDYLTFERRADGKLGMTQHSRLMGDSTGIR